MGSSRARPRARPERGGALKGQTAEALLLFPVINELLAAKVEKKGYESFGVFGCQQRNGSPVGDIWA